MQSKSSQPNVFSQNLTNEIVQGASTILLVGEQLQRLIGQMESDPQDEMVRQGFEALRQTALRMARAAENWQELHTENAMGLLSEKRVIDLAEQLENTVKTCKNCLDSSKKTLDFENSMQQSVYIAVDPMLVDKILLNLITNALRSANHVVVRLEPAENSEENCLIVQDDGPGLPPEIQEHLFEPDVTRYLPNPSRYGLGEGLCLVNRYCKLFGWTIKITSSEGSTQVQINIPEDLDAPDNLHSSVWNLRLETERKQQIEQEMSAILG